MIHQTRRLVHSNFVTRFNIQDCFKFVFLRRISGPTLFGYLADKLVTLLARVATAVGASFTGRGVALVDVSFQAVCVDAMTAAELTLDLVAAAGGGCASALIRDKAFSRCNQLVG